MQERRLLGAMFSIALIAMGCASSSGTPATSTGSSPTPSLAGGAGLGGGGASSPASSGSPSATAASSATAGPTPSLGELDPCALLTESDATTLIGPAVVHTQGGGAGTKGPCVYGDSTHDSVAVAIRVAPDVAGAGQLMTAQMNSLSAEGFKVTKVDLGNARINLAFEAKNKASGLFTDGIYVQYNVTIFYITTLSKTADPSDDAFKQAAETAIGNL